MKAKIRQQLHRRQRRIERRLDKTKLGGCHQPMFTARNIHYEFSDRIQGIAHGGIGAMHTLARQIGLIDAIDERLHVLKIHLPYHESDHVLNFAYNAPASRQVYPGGPPATRQSSDHCDRARGLGNVPLPDSFDGKAPSASNDWLWQFVFPSSTISPIHGQARGPVSICMKAQWPG